MQLQDFDFALPPDLIAQAPATRRDQSRLMVVQRDRPGVIHDVFSHIGRYLQAGDVLVVNNTKVIPARLRGYKAATGGKVEVLLLHETEAGIWEVLLKPAARTLPGTLVIFADGVLQGSVLEARAGGTVLMQFFPAQVYDVLEHCGEVPLPPYIKRPTAARQHALDRERYQTVYALHPGAVAAPTAGLHFTPELLATLAQEGIMQAAVTLHVGWGTFQPIRTTRIEQHHVGKEFYYLTEADAAVIQQARTQGGRVVAVGTTTLRTLETIVQVTGTIQAWRGWSELFIYPGYMFRGIPALVTNFHLPCSTLFLLVCALAGREKMLEAYQLAIEERYRFYSYGDAMLIL